MNENQLNSTTYRDDVIVLRSVFSKNSQMKYYIQPIKDPKTGLFPSCVKPVTATGEMIMSEKEKNAFSEGKLVLFPEDHVFIITDGTTFHLSNPREKAMWECIKHCKLIAKSRDEKDAEGNYIIDGKRPKNNNPGRNGLAELYIDRPGLEVARRISRKKSVYTAMQYIYNDERGADGQRNMALILGKDMYNQNINDVIDYLIRMAEKDPEKVISLYTGGDTTIRLLIIEAKKRHIINYKGGIYYYGDVILGATDEAVILYLKDPKNKKIVDRIEKDTYPEFSLKTDE